MRCLGVLAAWIIVFLSGTAVLGQKGTVDFESDRWTRQAAEIVEHLDRQSLKGTAILEDVDFENGIIEVDIAVDGGRSYPGIIFRYQAPGNYEKFYIRPHRSPLYPDAFQYMPVANGVGCWQLYNGDGYTAGGEIPSDQWFHVKMEIKGKQARVFVNDMQSPALVINNLKHGTSKGSIGVDGPRNGTAYFSNFEYELNDDLVFELPPQIKTPPGTITQWDLSQTFKYGDITPESYPDAKALGAIEWQTVSTEPTGLVNISRYIARMGGEPDCVFAKTIIKSDKDQTKKYAFGYSDDVSVFLNGRVIFAGESTYRQRDPSFLGIIGLFDAVFLPLEKGDNELLFVVTESFGGWGLMCRDTEAEFYHEAVTTAWATNEEFFFPESAVYDPERNVIYVSNYDPYNRSVAGGGQFVSTLTPEGKITDLDWVGGLNRPTGMVVWEDKLYVVERTGLAEIDIETKSVVNRYPIAQARFPNDVAVDTQGNFYVSDSGGSAIHRLAGPEFETWLGGGDIAAPNGLLVHDDKLIVGNNGDNSLKVVDLANKKITVLARLEPGIIDGIKVDKQGNLLVSHAEGRVFRVTASGDITTLIDTTGPGQYKTDFAYIVDTGLLVIPSLTDNRVVAYRLE